MPQSSAEVVKALKMQFRGGFELSVFCASPDCKTVAAFRDFSRHKVRETRVISGQLTPLSTSKSGEWLQAGPGGVLSTLVWNYN